MKWIPVVAETVQESLILLGQLLLDEVRSTIWNSRELLLELSFVPESASTAEEKARPNSGVELTRFS